MYLRSILFAATLTAASVALAGCGGAQTAAPANGDVTAAELPAEATCPVSGKTFAPTASTPTAQYEGKTYYLCCPGCAKKFAADPAKFAGAKEAAAEPAAALPASAVCPVSGETFTPTAETETAEFEGKTYYMCCPGCRGKFLADPASFVHEAEAASAEAGE